MAKGPKYVNPADKARKEARKKELKKNKKQRQQVRSAVIEKKDPEQIIADLEKLDRFEFDVATNPGMNDAPYKEKRRRLKESWIKLMEYYEKEDPDKHTKLKKLDSEYEQKYRKLAKDFEAIKAASEVKIEDIFLPPEPNTAINDIADDDPLMSETIYITPHTPGVRPPGCPPGLPPDLKSLAESLTIPLVTPIQPLPSDLLNLGLMSPNFTPAQDHSHNLRQKYGYRGQNNTGGGRLTNRPAKQRFDRPPIESPSAGATKTNPADSTKPAVIESKPVIFISKATKFLPSSVRSKVSATGAQRDKPKE